MRISDWSSDVCSSDLVDHRILAAQMVEACPVVAALVRAERDGAVETDEVLIPVVRQRLLDQLDAQFQEGRAELLEMPHRPGLVGIDDQPAFRRIDPDRPDRKSTRLNSSN